jgi:hypothetical protein
MLRPSGRAEDLGSGQNPALPGRGSQSLGDGASRSGVGSVGPVCRVVRGITEVECLSLGGTIDGAPCARCAVGPVPVVDDADHGGVCRTGGRNTGGAVGSRTVGAGEHCSYTTMRPVDGGRHAPPQRGVGGGTRQGDGDTGSGGADYARPAPGRRRAPVVGGWLAYSLSPRDRATGCRRGYHGLVPGVLHRAQHDDDVACHNVEGCRRLRRCGGRVVTRRRGRV